MLLEPAAQVWIVDALRGLLHSGPAAAPCALGFFCEALLVERLDERGVRARLERGQIGLLRRIDRRPRRFGGLRETAGGQLRERRVLGPQRLSPGLQFRLQRVLQQLA